jgi:hypothetical protein
MHMQAPPPSRPPHLVGEVLVRHPHQIVALLHGRRRQGLALRGRSSKGSGAACMGRHGRTIDAGLGRRSMSSPGRQAGRQAGSILGWPCIANSPSGATKQVGPTEAGHSVSCCTHATDQSPGLLARVASRLLGVPTTRQADPHLTCSVPNAKTRVSPAHLTEGSRAEQRDTSLELAYTGQTHKRMQTGGAPRGATEPIPRDRTAPAGGPARRPPELPVPGGVALLDGRAAPPRQALGGGGQVGVAVHLGARARASKGEHGRVKPGCVGWGGVVTQVADGLLRERLWHVASKQTLVGPRCRPRHEPT